MSAEQGADRWIVLAQVLRPQGRKGEVLAELLTDFPERLVEREGLYLAKEGFAGAADEARACGLVAAWLPKGRNEGRIVLEIGGITTIAEAEAISGYELLVEREKRVPLEEGAAYVSDLVGCAVYDGDRLMGTVKEVQFPTTPDGRRRMEQATPLLLVAVANSEEEAMVPFAAAFLKEVDLEHKVLRMELPEGLFDLSAAEGGAPAGGDA